MSYAVTCAFNEHFYELARYTHYGNKDEYAKKHDYVLVTKTSDFSTQYNINFEKMVLALQTFTQYPEVQWVFWLDTDALITNFNVKLEHLVDNKYHFIISEDINGLNAGSYLVRNSEEGRSYFRMILDNKEYYSNHPWYEQYCIQQTYESYKDIIKVVPQKLFNSYNYDLYRHQYNQDDKWNKFYSAGQWSPGDFVLHWPGVPNDQRLQEVKKVTVLK